MKKLGFLVVILMFVTGITYAQERGGGQRPSQSTQQGRPGGTRQQMSPEERVKQQTQRLVDELKLNKDQEAKVIAINKKYQAKQPDYSKMRDASDEERTKMRAEMMKVQTDKNKEIKAVLTADQVKLYDEGMKKAEEMRKKGQGRQGGGQRQQ